MQLKQNYILLTAIFPKEKNTVYEQLENCILSIVRLKQKIKIFIVTNNKIKVFEIIKKNKFYLNDFNIEKIITSKKNYLTGHKLSDFKYTFAKIQCLRIFLEKKIAFNALIISDIDALFTKKIKFLVNKKNIIFTALNYYSDQKYQNMDKIFSFFLKNYNNIFWINSGFMLLNRDSAKIIIKKIDKYFKKFQTNAKLIKQTIGHYGDEILFTLASNFIKKKILIEQSNSFYKNLYYSPLIAFIWTVNTGEKNYLRFLNPFKLIAHIHIPDLKYSKVHQKFIKKVLVKFKPIFADFILSSWINFKIIKNKILVRNLSKIKNLIFVK